MKKLFYAALTTLALTASPAAAMPVTPDTEMQLDVMAASSVISEELHGL